MKTPRWIAILIVLFASGCKVPEKNLKVLYIIDVNSGDIKLTSKYIDGTLFTSKATVTWYDDKGVYHTESLNSNLAVKETVK